MSSASQGQTTRNSKMAKSVPAGIYGRLKDHKTSISERLSLAHNVWFAESDVLPNKHQIIIDTVVGFLLNKKKKNELSQEEEIQIWTSLFEFLSSKDIDESGKYGSTLLVKPSLAQVILDYLEAYISRWRSMDKHTREAIVHVTGCCRVIIGTSSLSYVLTSRPEVLIALTGTVCQLCFAVPVSDNIEAELSVLLSEQCRHLWYHLHSQPNQAQVLKTVTEKLLQSVVCLMHNVGTIARLSRFKVCAENLRDFVVNALFHEEHDRLFRTFLDVVTKHQDTSQIPKLIENFFAKILHCCTQKDIPEKSKSSDSDRKAVLHFLPVVFRHAAVKWKKTPQQCFQLLQFLFTSLGMPEEGQVEKIPEDHIPALCDLLSVVRDHGVYNVAADRVAGEGQLKYFKHVLQVLLQSEQREQVCRCLLTVLQLNHQILETSMPHVLLRCCSPTVQDHDRSYSLDLLMSELVSTYSQLHQTPKWMNFILAYSDTNPQAVPMLFSLPTFSGRYRQAMCSLPHSTALDLWDKLLEKIQTHAQGFLNNTETSSDKLWGVSLLFHEFVSYTRLFDANVTGKAVWKIQMLQKDLEEKVIVPCEKQISQKRKDKLAARSCLLLAFCLGNVKLMLAQYKTSRSDPDQFLVKKEELPFSLKRHEWLQNKKSVDEDTILHYLVDLLAVQDLQAFGEATHLEKRSEMETFWVLNKDISSRECSQTWNGSVATVKESTYSLAEFLHTVHKMPLLLSTVLHEKCSDLSRFLVEIFSKSDAESLKKEGSEREKLHEQESHFWHLKQKTDKLDPGKQEEGHTLLGTARMFLCNSAAAENRQFLEALVCALWKEISTEFCPPASHKNHKRKKTFHGQKETTLFHIGESDIPWNVHSDSRVQSIGQSVNEILESEDAQPITLSTQQRNLLQILHYLPLAYLPPGSQLQCILGLLVLLSLQPSEEFTPTRILDIGKPVARYCGQFQGCLSDRAQSCVHRTPDTSVTELSPQMPVSDDVKTDGTEHEVREPENCLQHCVGDELCWFLKVLLDASTETSVFRCVDPRLLVHFLSRLYGKCSAEEGSPLGFLLKKVVGTVLSDFQNVLELDGFISELRKRVKNISKRLSEAGDTLNLPQQRQILTVVAYILQESRWHLKKNFHHRDVKEAAQRHFRKLSSVITHLVDTVRQRACASQAVKIPAVLMQCLTAVVRQGCADMVTKGECLEMDFVQRVEFLVQNILDQQEVLSAKVSVSPEPADLHFLSCVYKNHTSFSSLLTEERTRAVWKFLQRCLLESLDSTSGGVGTDTSVIPDVKLDVTDEDVSRNASMKCSAKNQTSAISRKRSLPRESGFHDSASKGLNLVFSDAKHPVATSCVGVTSKGEEMEMKIEKTLTDLLLSCDIHLFEELVDGVVTEVHVKNLTKPLLMQAAIRTWQSIVAHSNIRLEQRQTLEKLSLRYLLQTIPVTSELSTLSDRSLSQRVEIYILDSFTTMLAVDKYLSAKGTMLCLESCLLVDLNNVGDVQFFPAFNAVFGVLHAVLVHHPYTALKVIPAFLTATKSLLRECILRGDQAKLIGRPAYVDNMVKCANCVSRLLTLFAAHRTELHRVAAYVVSDYANWVKRVTLLPAVKKTLLPGVYAFLDLCDKHALSQLRTMLPPGVREVFHVLHDDYQKYFRYTGKV